MSTTPTTATPGAIAGNELPEFRFAMEDQPAKVLPAGSAREVTVAELPISEDLAGVSMWLEPGGLREPHWHPNAAEWFYVLAGEIGMTLFGSQGRAKTETFGVGDVGYVPMGYGHYLQNCADGTSRILLGFNAGTYEQISLSGWLGANPRQLVASNFSLPLTVVAQFPDTTEVITADRN